MISLCMIVKNEETTLSQCLESVQDLVEEIVIIDTGSTDATVKIAQDFDAKVYHYLWNHDFAAARNHALQYVTGDWVLVLDADEVLVPTVIPDIQKAISQENNLVVNLLRQEIGSASSPFSLVSRLFRNHPQLKFTRPYHAIIDDRVTELLQSESYWRIVDLPSIAINHYGYNIQVIAAKDKTIRAKIAMEKYFHDHPHDAYVCSKLGALYLQIGEEKKGIKLLKTGLKSNQGEAPVIYELHYHLANALVKQKDLERAEKHYQKAIEQSILPQIKVGAYHNLAGIYQLLNQWEKALTLSEKCLEIIPNFALGYYNLGLIYKNLGRTFKAISAYQKAIELDQENPYPYQNLGVLWLKQGSLQESVECFKKAINLHQKRQNLLEAKRLTKELKAMGIVISDVGE
jgi:tetratricopeptide (TPR) repeat protein